MKHDRLRQKPISFASTGEMPFSTVSLASMEWNETGKWRYLRPRYVEGIPACQHACPTSNNIETWIRFFEQGKIGEAYESAVVENPFPAIMGRVCFHPCMNACNRKEMGGPVTINMIERCLGDEACAELPPAKPFFPESGKQIAIIGAGPAGLSCAYHLTRLGHKVLVFEKMPNAGGMLRYGIPAYRLPREVIGREVSRLVKMGIEFRLGKQVKDAGELQELRQHYSAVFISTGAWKSKTLGIDGEKSTGVMAGLEFLRRTAEGHPPQIGKKVLVIGGGNTAIDTARTARRFGSEVKIIYRRSRAEMPAFEEEICQALEEGVVIEMLLMPSRVLLKQNHVAGLSCRRMQLGAPDESGRRKAFPIEGEDVAFDADTIMVAIGEEIDKSIIPSALPMEGGLVKTGICGRTEWSNVFAGGDFIAGARTVVNALGAGKRSAIAIDCLLHKERFEDVFEKIRVELADEVLISRYVAHRGGSAPKAATTSETTNSNHIVRFADINTAYFTESKPNLYPAAAPEERIANGSFAEVHKAPSRQAKTSELSRCFHCGRCTECDNCWIYCPDVAIAKKEGGFEMDYYFCKGCGVCAAECPRAAIEMIEEPAEI